MNKLELLEHRRIGRTHMEVTAISLGGAGLGGIFGPVGDADGVAAVEKAFELGINYLDTSPSTARRSVAWVWRCAACPASSYYISSKVGTHPNRQPGDYSAEAARWTVDNSLKVLGVDYLDLCHIHEPERKPARPGAGARRCARGARRPQGAGRHQRDRHRGPGPRAAQADDRDRQVRRLDDGQRLHAHAPVR